MSESLTASSASFFSSLMCKSSPLTVDLNFTRSSRRSLRVSRLFLRVSSRASSSGPVTEAVSEPSSATAAPAAAAASCLAAARLTMSICSFFSASFTSLSNASMLLSCCLSASSRFVSNTEIINCKFPNSIAACSLGSMEVAARRRSSAIWREAMYSVYSSKDCTVTRIWSTVVA